MLFNSLLFIFLFLPLAWGGYYLCTKISHRLAMAWLVGASLLFYGWWTPLYFVLLCSSILFNYTVGVFIQKTAGRDRLQMAVLASGVGANLLLLCYYKYLFPMLHWLEQFGVNLVDAEASVLLPLGISFFTFTQIGYLIDCKAGLASGRRFLDYALFVTFFPHLIAGPILHHREMMPQFEDRATWRFNLDNFAVGLCIFILGLAKKVLIADYFAGFANRGFQSLGELSALENWLTILSYSMQLYFDFSGYSEMAIGLALLFNVRFPPNFDSPYKSNCIIDFWQRWHMTLTRYLTLYLYNPVALWVTRYRTERKMAVGRVGLKSPQGFLAMVAFPTVFTMLLAGIWHGAGLQFIIWGLLHACYLVINHAWRLIFHKKNAPQKTGIAAWLDNAWAVGLTYLAVLVAQIFFRAHSTEDALTMIGGMLGQGQGAAGHFESPAKLALAVGAALVFVWSVPNILQIFAPWNPTLTKPLTPMPGWLLPLQWRPTLVWGLVIGILAALAILSVSGTTEFLYFRF